MQIEGSRVQASMPEQDLDRPQVGPGLQLMSGEAMAQRVRADPLSQTCFEGGGFADSLNRAGSQRRAGVVARKQPVGGALAPPVFAQLFKQRLPQQRISVLGIPCLGGRAAPCVGCRCPPPANSGLRRDADRPSKSSSKGSGVSGCRLTKKSVDLLEAEYHGQLLRLSGKGDVLDVSRGEILPRSGSIHRCA